ncbi:hypothetical protein EVJ58_g6829 [Rhodofomes roseus]|uniref:Uncharacterized protein n=1 Tax=Rhodofomes roseus TaxID=34475 RepID=A0A4Y9Y5I5_9APHY|nr:hypothetical protein EVJ58_g6829 [Rhodofomes roseus]
MRLTLSTQWQCRDADRSLSRMRGKVNDHQRLVVLLANNDVQRLHHLLSVALRKGASPKALIAQIDRAINGLYCDRGQFDERKIKAAFLSKVLGGPRLLFALTKSDRFPSGSTVGRRMKIPELDPSISTPTRPEFKRNFASLCNPEHNPLPPRYGSTKQLAGLVVMVDGIAIEERCRYLPSRNAIAGLAREDAGKVSLEVKSYEDVQKVENALLDGVCSHGKDATVVSIAPYARVDHYNALPLVVSPSNKRETGEQLAHWLWEFCDSWRTDPHGEAVRGAFWALASDGDAAFRLAKHIICSTHAVPVETDLGSRLSRLKGMNRMTSATGIVATCDPKHVFKLLWHKGFATLIRNPRGILIDDTHLQSTDFFEHLKDLPNMSPEKASRLLDPADKQNVPKAVHLIQELLNIETHAPRPLHDLFPGRSHRRHILSFFARVLGFFVLPFVTVSMPLAEQIRSLATYSHLVAVLWVRHGTAFMNGGLYADSQSIVKNIIYTVLRLQLLDDNIPFHIILEGTDRLESLFGNCRTQDHNRNFDVLQLCQKLSVATMIDLIFESEPDWDRGHRRLDLKDALGIDHVNPRSWTGDVRVGEVDVAIEWARGRYTAEQVIIQFLGPDTAEAFETLYDADNCDLLRPEGTYVGVRHDPGDEVEETIASAHAPENIAVQTSAQDSDTSDDSNGFDDVPVGLGVEDFLPETGQDLEDDVAMTSSDDRFVMVEGKRYLKASVVTALLTSSRARKVPLRTLRNRGVTFEDMSGGDKWNNSELTSGNLVKTGDLAASLLRVQSTICLAVVEITGFRCGSGDDQTYVSCISVDDLEDRAAAPTVSVQVLDMFTPEPSTDSAEKRSWQWTHSYIRLDSQGNSQRIMQRQHTINIPGHLIHPLGPTIIALRLSNDQVNQPIVPRYAKDSRIAKTWSIAETQLDDILTFAWESLSPGTEDIIANIEHVPSVSTQSLPYQDTIGNDMFTILDVPTWLTIEKKAGSDVVPCLICGSKEAVKNMRNHIGRHILYSMRGIHENVPYVAKLGVEPCGFCGMDGCPYHYTSMSYGAAKTPRTIWKYNVLFHLAKEHCTDNDELPPIPLQLAIDMHISIEEESLMRVAKDVTEDWRKQHAIPGSDEIEEYREELKASQTKGKKRLRSQSTAVVERGGPKPRRR